MARGAKTSGARTKIDVLFFFAETGLLFPKLFPNNRRRPTPLYETLPIIIS